jgi:fucose 4-O-acetylase-like acetyltransferase
MTDNGNLDWVFISKGIGIILVVAGHFYPDGSPAYWRWVRNVIYEFHMPLFFVLSGYLYDYRKFSYPDLIKRKANRLLLPYVSLALIFFVMKSVSGYFVKLEYPVDLSSTWNMLIDPVKSYVPLLWFIHALLLIFIAYPPIRCVVDSNLLILIALVVLNLFVSRPLFGLNNVILNFPFFAFGVELKTNSVWRFLVKSQYGIPVLFIMFVFVHCVSSYFDANLYVVRFLLGIAGSLLVINVGLSLSRGRSKGRFLLGVIGYYSMTVYLFHTFFESFVRIFFFQVIDFSASAFLLVAAIAVTSGVVFPLYLEKWILRRYLITRRLLLGLA